VKADLIAILEELGYPVFLQGTLQSEEDYPESFFTFWNYSTPEACFYDNDANTAVWGFWVYFYSTDPTLVLEKSEAARQLLKANGFTPDGKPTDLPVDVPEYTGAMFTVYKSEEYHANES
jgi:hypothetical protein